jgi:hypothetical protein
MEMIRKLKSIGLALAAVCALSVVMVSAAQAKPWHVSAENTRVVGHPKEHAILHGTQAKHPNGNDGSHVFTAGEGFGGIKCTNATFTGTLTEGTGQLVRAKPDYSSCSDSFGRTVDVEENGCEYDFEATAESGGSFTGDADVVCPAGKVIEAKITSGGSVICTVKIGSQTGTGPIKFENDEDKATGITDVTITPQVTNIKNTTEGGFFNCGISNGEHTGGTYTGNTTVQAFDTENKLLDLKVHTKN